MSAAVASPITLLDGRPPHAGGVMASGRNNWQDPDTSAAFCSAWNSDASIEEIALQFGLSLKSVMARATILRSEGLKLRRRAGANARFSPATVMLVFSDDHRSALAAATMARSTTAARLISDIVAELLEDVALLDSVLDDGVTTPGAAP